VAAAKRWVSSDVLWILPRFFRVSPHHPFYSFAAKPIAMIARSVLICLVTLLIAGCGGSTDVVVYPTSGVVNFEGKAMSGGGSISFVPTTSQAGKAAGGIINADGTFVMSTYGDGDGAMAGTFRVMIVQTTTAEPDFGGDSDAPGAAAKAEGTSTVDKADVIPLIYADPVNSPVTVTIEAKDKNELTIELNRSVAGSPGYGA
jgi:hypothetical protein